ncbi:hypothetical protein MKW94_020504 [Papaver nudicaule]|uniref:Pectinesterase n=1 Tax=Papaver nudicaule TaxID=74823 RepID=A0AA41S2Q9_PAPNU|nr:hypothetical protein [Papaver nudicaule]
MNTAGPAMGQAVALRQTGNHAIYNRCKMDGFQDTLYVHRGRQFYRDCLVMGTVDIIFGDASVVFQGCTIMPKLPLPGQNNMTTSQGRTKDTNTGISIQNCTIVPSPSLEANVTAAKTYLGRPWKQFSRTIFMESYIDSFIDAEGWHKMEGAKFGVDQLFYGKYENWGPGADTSKRVNWSGYHDPVQALDFTVAKLIGGDWLDSNIVNYTLGIFNETH